MPRSYSVVRDGKRWTWSVERLWTLSKPLNVFEWLITGFDFELDVWFCGVHVPTIAAVLDHHRRIQSADLSRPIILSVEGAVMDGVHRICKAHLEDRPTVPAVQFAQDPTPDEIGQA